MFAFAAVTYIISFFVVPETYAPTLLRAKAQKLQAASEGQTFYISKFDKANTLTKKQLIKLNMTRPFVLLFKEPIVLLLSIYTAIICQCPFSNLHSATKTRADICFLIAQMERSTSSSPPSRSSSSRPAAGTPAREASPSSGSASE